MVITKKDIKNLREKSFFKISGEQEKEILNLFGKEPDDVHEWTEQDIYTQIGKMIKQ